MQGSTFFAGFSTFLSSPNTHAVEPTFFTTVHSVQGVPKHGKNTIVYKGSSSHFPKVQIFLLYKYHTQVSAVLQERHLFHRSSAVLSFPTLTQNPSISANFNQFCYIRMQMNSHSACYHSFSKTYLESKTLYNYIYIFIFMYISIFQLEDNSSFLQCLYLSPHNTHCFHAKHLLSSAHAVEPLFFTKAPSLQGSSMASKKNIVYKGCSPSIGCASGITAFERKGKKTHER